MRHPLLACLPALALVLGAASPARAEPAPRVSVRLDYLRGPGAEACPATADTIREDVTRRLGYDPFNASAPARLTIVVARQPGAWAATVERSGTDGPPWKETFRRGGADCAPFLARFALALHAWLQQGVPGTLPANGRIFGVEYDDDPPSRAPAPGPALVPAPAPVAAVEPRPDSAQPAPAPAAAKRFELAAMANLVGSGEPAVTGGATLRAALRWTWLSAGAELRFDAPAGAAASGIMGAPAAHYDGRLIAGALVPCAVYEGESVQPFGCAVVLGGAMTETGTGVMSPGTDTHFLLATGPRVGLDIPLHVPRVGLALRASFDGLFFPVGARFHLAGSQVWNTPPFSAVGSLGLAVFL